MRSYNNTYHRSIGMAPSRMNAANQEVIWQRLYVHDGKGVAKVKVDDRVRISKAKRRFEKGYMANWSEELFTTHAVPASIHPCTEPELQKISVSKDKL